MKSKIKLITKHFILILFIILTASDLIGQKHQFGVLAGAQRQGHSGIGIDSNEERLFFNNYNPTQPHAGFYFRHQLDKCLYLEAAPIFYRENLTAQYINPTTFFNFRKETEIRTTTFIYPFCYVSI